MKLSSKERCALCLMADIAAYGGEKCVSLKDVSARQDISVKYLEQIVPHLLRAGLLKSARGAKGGYALVKPVERYTAGEILHAAAAKVAPAQNTVDAFASTLLAAAYAYANSVPLRDMFSPPVEEKRRSQAAYLLD